MKNSIKKMLYAVPGFFTNAVAAFNNIFNKGNPSDNPAGKGTGNEARPRRRLVDGIDAERFTRLCVVLVVGFVSIIGAVLISAVLNSGGRQISIGDQQNDSVKNSGQFTLSLGGSIMPTQDMLDSAVTENGYNFGNYMSELSEVMSGDLSIAGLYGQIDASGGNENIGGFGSGSNYPSQLAAAVSEIGVNYIFGANNYAFANGYNGMCATVSNLHRNSVGLIGLTDTNTQKLNCSVIQVNEINVGLAGYNCVDSNAYNDLSDEQKTYTAQLDTNSENIAATVSSDITKMRSGGAEFIVICINWGTGADTTEADFIKQAVNEIAESGADVIVGYGPYVTMSSEVIEYEKDGTNGECYVFYSLGCLFADMTERGDYSAAMSRSMTVALHVVRGSNGTVAVDYAEYNPIYMIKNADQSEGQLYLKYLAVPAAKYVAVDEKPDIFTDNEQWKRCKEAFTEICALADKTDGKLVLNELLREDLTSDVADTKI